MAVGIIAKYISSKEPPCQINSRRGFSRGHVKGKRPLNLADLLSPLHRATFALTKPLKMNMVKRIMGRPRQEECSPQDNALGLMHLRRLFAELCHPPRHMTQKEQEEKLYMMLPVFNRVSHMEGGRLELGERSHSSKMSSVTLQAPLSTHV